MAPYLFGVLVSTAQLVLGLAAGIWWCKRNLSPLPSTSQLDAPGIRQLISRLQSVATHMADDVGQYSNDLNESAHRIAVARARQASDEDQLDASPLTDVVVGVVREVVDLNGQLQQKLSSAESKIQRQSDQIETYLSEARTDPLTELANRRALDDELACCVARRNRRGGPVSLMFLDVDHFKKLNDRHGHVAGDTVLRNLARVLQATMRQTDLVARFGGEEFAIVLPDTNIDEARQAAVRVRDAAREATFTYEKTRLPVTISVGVAELLAGEDAATLLARADEAVYASKEAGRDRAYYHDGCNCLPVEPAQRVTATASPVVANLPPKTTAEPVSPELAEACDELRQSVARMTRPGRS